jgi:hypothetical protein
MEPKIPKLSSFWSMLAFLITNQFKKLIVILIVILILVGGTIAGFNINTKWFSMSQPPLKIENLKK